MTTLPQQMAGYNTKAQATRSKRKAAGKYNRPTAAQDAAFRRYISPHSDLQAGDLAELASHPWLTVSQRAAFLAHAPLTDAQIEAEHEDYANDIADRTFWARGAW